MAAQNYTPVDLRMGTSAPGPYAKGPSGYVQWTASQTWAAGATCYNGGFLFRTVSGGAGATSGNGPSPIYLTDASCTWVLVGGANPFTVSESSPSCDLGEIVKGRDDAFGLAEFMYVKFTGSTAIVAGDFIAVDRYGMTGTQATTTSRGLIGIAMGSHALNTATPTYGWVMIRGVHVFGKANATCAINSTIYMLAAGTPTTASTAGTGVSGVIAKVAAANGQATFDVYYPYMAGTVA